MSRYLTPAKIGLLALTTLYCETDLSGSTATQLLLFVTSQICPPGRLDNDTPSPAQAELSDFEDVLASLPSTFPGRSLFDAWLKRIWSIDSLHNFHSFFTSLDRYVAKPLSKDEVHAEDEASLPKVILSRVSPLGLFVRRARLEFTRIQFDEAVKLWLAFQQFRAPSKPAFQKRHSSASTHGDSFDTSELDLDKGSQSWTRSFPAPSHSLSDELLSEDDLDRILEIQLDKFQRFGTCVSPAMQSNLKSAHNRSQQTSSLLSFVRFFDAWKSGDYYSSFDSLHRYFDSTMQAGDRSCYQYALLHMAVLQADFGCFSEALATMNETIAIARENQDMHCLNFGLSWLNHLNRAHPVEMKEAGYTGVAGMEKAGLTFLKSKAKESSNWELLSSTLSSEASLMLSEGDSVTLIMERLYQIAGLNLKHSLESQYITQLLLFSNTLARIGCNQMALSYCNMVIDCFARLGAVDELTHARSLQIQLRSKASMQTTSNSLGSAKPTIPVIIKSQQSSNGNLMLVQAATALRRNQLRVASTLLASLQQHPALDEEAIFQTSCLYIEYQAQLSNYSQALNHLSKLSTKLLTKKADISQRVQVLILRATIFAQAGRPEKGFSALVRAAAIASHAKLLPLLWKAIGELANLLCSLGEFELARQLLDNAIPQSFATADTSLIARLFSVQADAFAGLAGNNVQTPIQQQKYLARASDHLDKAEIHARRVDDLRLQCSLFARQSLIARTRGDISLAENWAEKYLRLRTSTLDPITSSV